MIHLKRQLKRTGGHLFRSWVSITPFFRDIRIILTYHRVVERIPDGFCDPVLFVTTDTLEMHMNILLESFDIMPLEDVIEPNQRSRCCAITFDDGWLDSYKIAFPILKKYQIPATVFLPVGVIGSNHWFWFESLWNLATQAIAKASGPDFIQYFHDQVPSWESKGLSSEDLFDLISNLKQLPADDLDGLITEGYKSFGLNPSKRRIIMDWEEVSEMGRNGITFAPHGLRHYILPTLDYSTKRKEICESLEILRSKGVPVAPFFSYPNGDWDDESLALVSEAGYLGAVTTRLGYNTPRTPPFLLNRISIHEDIGNSPSLFWCRVLQAVIAGSGSQTN